jgi:hypothetical protein
VKIKRGPGWIGTKVSTMHLFYSLHSKDNYSEYCSLRSCKFLGFCSSVVEVSACVRYGTASLCPGLTLFGFMSIEDTEHTTLNFRSVFLANYGTWRHYFLLGYYNFKVYLLFSLLRTEQFCHPKKVCHSSNIQNIYYKKFQIEGKNVTTSWKKLNYVVKKCMYLQVHGEILQ